MEAEYPRSVWRRIFALGTDPSMPYLVHRRIWIANAAAWSMIVVGLGYLLANFLQDQHHLLGQNIASIVVGIFTLTLTTLSFPSAACVFLSIASCAVFSYGSLKFFNGTQDYIVINVMVAWFLMNHLWSRLALVVINSVAFIAIRLVQFPHYDGVQVPFDRYVVTTVLVVVTASVISEYIRRLDASYRRRQEENAQRLAEANQAKQRLFSLISHDLRGPVGNLKATLDALQAGDLDAETVKELLPALNQDVHATHNTLENLLYWSAQQVDGIRSLPEPVVLLRAVEETKALLANAATAKRIKVEHAVEPGTVVLVDPEQLRTILRNLISNALKFTPQGGQVEITSSTKERQVQVTISDNGVGIAPGDAEKLFEEKGTARPGTAQERGFGIGLSICRSFVEQNKGRIWVEPNPGGGSRFCFTLPVA